MTHHKGSASTYTVSFSPQNFSPDQTWEIHDGLLTTPEGKRILLENLVEARYSDGSFRQRPGIFFDLVTPAEKVTIWCKDRFRGERRRRCFTLLFAIIKSLKRHNPELLIQLGTNAQTRSLTAVIGCIPAFCGLIFLGLAIEEGAYLSAIAIGLFSLLAAAIILWDVPLNPESSELAPEEFEAWLRDRTKEELSKPSRR
ncbi:MAG: hypothetical protein AAFQ63_08705 [Cyanobacteria bacterium J06621_11]